MDQKFIPYLTELASKYAISKDMEAALEPGAIRIHCSVGDYRFFYDFSRAMPCDGMRNIPLFHWQNKRRYVELRNILDQKLVEIPLALRIHHIVPRDTFTRTVKDILVYEAGLTEFITRQKIEKIFSSYSQDYYVNCILSTDQNVKISMELGFSPEGSQPVILHEIIAKSGIASDVAVDTQTQQYPVYVFKGEETLQYTDIDNELYGIENTQADCIRFILEALSRPGYMDTLCERFAHLEQIYDASLVSNESISYTAVEG